MPTAASIVYTGTPLVPFYAEPKPQMQNVALPVSVVYARGQVMGEVWGTNEVQTITFAVTAGQTIGGTYTLSYAGQTTGSISATATAATVQAALEALATIGTGNVAVTGTVTVAAEGGVLTVTFQNALGGQNVVPLTATDSLTGTGHAITIATGTAGTGPANEIQTIARSGTVSGGTFLILYAGQTTTAIAYDATAAAVQTALEALSNIAPGDVTVTGAPTTAYVLHFAGALAGTNVAAVTIDNTAITGGGTYVVATESGGAGAKGTFRAYDAAGTDGRQIPRGLLAYDAASDAAGLITWGGAVGASDHSIARPYVPVYFGGCFATRDLVGLTAAAITAAGWTIISGTVADGVIRLS